MPSTSHNISFQFAQSTSYVSFSDIRAHTVSQLIEVSRKLDRNS